MTTSFEHDSRKLAETYDRVSDLQFEGGTRLLERLGLAEGAHVLDVGCGTGRLARWIAERIGPNGSVAGIDPLAERVAIARAQGGGARFEVGVAEDLHAFGDASFDIVCMTSVFHWIQDKARALAEARRVLRPGGSLGVTTFPQELGHAGSVAKTLVPLFAREPYVGRIDLSVLTFARRGLTTTGVVSLLLDAGLELVELHVTQRTRQHATGEALVDFLQASAFGNFLRIVPDDLQDSFRADLVAAFDAQRGPDGVRLRDWALIVVARR